jgi:hypothetical protein
LTTVGKRITLKAAVMGRENHMANAMVKRLRDALERIEEERTRLDRQAEAFRQVIAYFEADGDEDDSPARMTPAKAITNEMWKILEEAQEPLHYQLIYERLKDRGVPVPGKEPSRNVGAHLSNDPRFENVGRGLWGLKSWSAQNAALRTGSSDVLEISPSTIPSLAPPTRDDDLNIDPSEDDDIARLFASLSPPPE